MGKRRRILYFRDESHDGGINSSRNRTSPEEFHNRLVKVFFKNLPAANVKMTRKPSKIGNRGQGRRGEVRDRGG